METTMTLTAEIVLDRVIKAGTKGLLPNGGEAKFIFALSQAGKIKAVLHKAPVTGMTTRYVAL
jgi:hypothetical protein